MKRIYCSNSSKRKSRIKERPERSAASKKNSVPLQETPVMRGVISNVENYSRVAFFSTIAEKNMERGKTSWSVARLGVCSWCRWAAAGGDGGKWRNELDDGFLAEMESLVLMIFPLQAIHRCMRSR